MASKRLCFNQSGVRFTNLREELRKRFYFRYINWCSTDIGRLDIESKVKMEIYSYVLKVANHYPNSDYLDALLMPMHVMDGFERIHNNVDTDW
jgi:hypothetical protein